MAMQRLLQWAAPDGAVFSPARLLLLGLIAVAFNLTAACSSPSGGNRTAAPMPVQTTIGTLLDRYESNKLAADKRFKYSENGGRPVQVTRGIVAEVENDYTVIAESSRVFGFGRQVRCYYADETQALNIYTGQEVVITGEGDGVTVIFDIPTLRDCRIAAPTPTPAPTSTRIPTATPVPTSTPSPTPMPPSPLALRPTATLVPTPTPYYGTHAYGDSRAAEFRSPRRLRGVRNRAARANRAYRRLPIPRLERCAGNSQCKQARRAISQLAHTGSRRTRDNRPPVDASAVRSVSRHTKNSRTHSGRSMAWARLLQFLPRRPARRRSVLSCKAVASRIPCVL